MERTVKGNHVLPLHDYVQEAFTGQELTELYGDLRPETKEMLRNVTRDDWVPVEHVADINGAVYRASENREQGFSHIVKAGNAIGSYAANTYVRLLIKLMTPRIMASKWPDIWKKSHRFGEMTCRLESERLLRINLSDVAGYTHIAPTAIGFLTFSLNAMGLADANVRLLCDDYSEFDAPSYDLEVTW